ncbi:MAG: hypothetical protein Q9219_006574 [cf. Caloplaca sp. 3 TL-2023]
MAGSYISSDGNGKVASMLIGPSGAVQSKELEQMESLHGRYSEYTEGCCLIGWRVRSRRLNSHRMMVELAAAGGFLMLDLLDKDWYPQVD